MLHKFIIIIINVFITESIITVFLHHNHHYSTNTLFATHFFLVECINPLENIKNKPDILKLSCCFRK